MVRVDSMLFHFTTPRNIFLEVLALLGNITELAMEQVAVTEPGLCSGQSSLPQHCVGRETKRDHSNVLVGDDLRDAWLRPTQQLAESNRELRNGGKQKY